MPRIVPETLGSDPPVLGVPPLCQKGCAGIHPLPIIGETRKNLAFGEGKIIVSDDLFGAPAGWYPDPLGLPQLRWWNNHAWTEQTSAARQPMVVQDTKFAWADDELPTRRDERERERQRDERKPADVVQPTAATLRELEPPRAFTKVEESVAAPVTPPVTAPAAAAATAPVQDVPVTPAAASQPTAESLFASDPITPQPAAAAAAEPVNFGSLFDTVAPTAPAGTPGGESLDALFGADSSTRRGQKRAAPIISQEPIQQAQPQQVINSKTMSSTAPSWIISMIPLFQLVLSLLFLTAFGLGNNVVLFVGILVVPYFIVVGLAVADHRLLKAAGHVHPAHWAWAFLTAPVYLLVRARAVIRQTGHGIGPVLVWFGLGVLHVASVVAVPGLLIAVLPTVFSAQIAQSVERDAALTGGSTMSVSCPATPPLLEGQEIKCSSLTAAGTKGTVTVTLDRSIGWFGWQVTDWGVYQMASGA